jgi:hypothetical protein
MELVMDYQRPSFRNEVKRCFAFSRWRRLVRAGPRYLSFAECKLPRHPTGRQLFGGFWLPRGLTSPGNAAKQACSLADNAVN